MSKNNVYQQFFLSIFFVVLATSIYLLVTYYLDKIMNAKLSNAIGIVIDTTLDFIFQSWVFLGLISLKSTTIFKFITGKFISMGSGILIFNFYYDLYQKLNKKQNKKQNKNNLYLRIFAMITTGLLITFPLRKYWIYIK